MSHRAQFLTIAQLLTALVLSAQTLTVGPNFSGTPNGGGDSSSGQVRTVIDLSRPATATGIVTSVHIAWSTAGCANAVKIKFFRDRDRLTLVAERGPFNVSATDFTVTLSPPVPIMAGDFIGLTRLTNCGTPMLFNASDATYAYFSSDFRGPVDGGYNVIFGKRLAVGGVGVETRDILRGVVPVVGSTIGGAGSNFRTSMQMLNTGANGTVMTGKLVFHPAGVSGSSNDPTLTYAINPGQVISYPDVVSMFGRSGLGSVDVMATQSAPMPLILTTVFNDAGTAGTSGLTEDFIDVADGRVLNTGMTGFLITPAESNRTRFNIGVRTLLAGATLTALLRDANGITVRTVTRTYLPNWFEQVSASSFFGGATIGSSQSVAVTVTSGSAIVYGTTTDNTTNDPNIQFARAPNGS